MKAINAVQVWKNGEEKQANMFNLVLINDDLATNANFYYQLLASSEVEGNVSTEQLADGNVSMSGEDYLDWDGSNDAAYEYVAGKLNLVITGDYVPPVPPQPVLPEPEVEEAPEPTPEG
jgi:hypothetical protein